MTAGVEADVTACAAADRGAAPGGTTAGRTTARGTTAGRSTARGATSGGAADRGAARDRAACQPATARWIAATRRTARARFMAAAAGQAGGAAWLSSVHLHWLSMSTRSLRSNTSLP